MSAWPALSRSLLITVAATAACLGTAARDPRRDGAAPAGGGATDGLAQAEFTPFHYGAGQTGGNTDRTLQNRPLLGWHRFLIPGPSDALVDSPARDTGGGETADNICANYNVATANSMLSGITALAFCSKYMSVCTFTGAMRYTSLEDCITKYGAAPDSVKSCRAAHLCNAILAGQVTQCPHATGFIIPACI
jgi:hypothetical protein